MTSTRWRPLILGSIVAPWLVVPRSLAARQPRPQASPAETPLGPRDIFSSYALGLNNTGAIAGQFSLLDSGDAGFAVRWDKRAISRLTPLSFDVGAAAFDVSDSGRAVGASISAEGAWRAVQWANEETTVLPPLPGDGMCYAAGINVRGQIVGSSESADGEASTAVLWENDQVVALPPLPGDTHSQAWHINDEGLVVGQSWANDEGHAVRWEDGAPIALGELPGHAWGLALSINNAGRVVGWSEDPDTVQPVLWADGEIVALGSPSPDIAIQGVAYDINEAGDIVGLVFANDGNQHAALWRDGDLVELGMLPGHAASTALAVNDAGRIVGWSAVAGDSVTRSVGWDDGDIVALEEPTIVVAIDPFGFAPVEVTVTPGQEVVVINTGVLEHDLVVDEWAIGTNLLPSLDQAVLTIPDDAGVGMTVPFHCSAPGHREAGMVGTFVVAASAP